MSLFTRQVVEEVPESIPAGSFTINSQGHLIGSTLPSSFPNSFLLNIAEHVTTTFEEARTAGLPMSELAINYPDFKLAARELSGGAIVFFIPR